MRQILFILFGLSVLSAFEAGFERIFLKEPAHIIPLLTYKEVKTLAKVNKNIRSLVNKTLPAYKTVLRDEDRRILDAIVSDDIEGLQLCLPAGRFYELDFEMLEVHVLHCFPSRSPIFKRPINFAIGFCNLETIRLLMDRGVLPYLEDIPLILKFKHMSDFGQLQKLVTVGIPLAYNSLSEANGVFDTLNALYKGFTAWNCFSALVSEEFDDRFFKICGKSELSHYLNVLDENGKTPISYTDDVMVRKVLLENGANSDAPVCRLLPKGLVSLHKLPVGLEKVRRLFVGTETAANKLLLKTVKVDLYSVLQIFTTFMAIFVSIIMINILTAVFGL